MIFERGFHNICFAGCKPKRKLLPEFPASGQTIGQAEGKLMSKPHKESRLAIEETSVFLAKIFTGGIE